jgi:hypothetical protein
MESVPPRHKEEDELGAENRPEHIAVSDGGKPEPIDQDITREAQCRNVAICRDGRSPCGIGIS